MRFVLLCALALAAGCRQEPPKRPAPPRGPYTTTLRFDRRYLDSMLVPPPYSPGVTRQRAILGQLERLRMARRLDSLLTLQGDPDTSRVPEYHSQTVKRIPRGLSFSSDGSAPTVFRNRAAWLADIRRKIDSLETLEAAEHRPSVH